MSGANKGLLITKPGASATVQDIGRNGFRQHGLAKGGALDLHAFHWANKLLANPMGAACLEILLGGFEAIAEIDITLAVTGAETTITINGNKTSSWQTIHLRAGDHLDISHAGSGRIIYLAMTGGIKSPASFGSQSVVAREQIEDLKPLAAGIQLCPRETDRTPGPCWISTAAIPGYRKELTLKIIPGYQYTQFTRQDLLHLTTQDYVISQQSDRMGYRLNGTALNDVPPGIISEGIAEGALQIPGDGHPIVLMNDCQTIGGYPKPGVVACLDRCKLAQRLPGQKVRFAFTDLASAQNELRLFNRFFEKNQWDLETKCWTWT